jgi:hypothetical protein
MTVEAPAEVWFDALAAVPIEGIAATFAGGRAPQIEGGSVVQPMIDEALEETPAAVYGYGGAEIILAGQWEGAKHSIDLSIWVLRDDIATAYARCISFIDRVGAAFPSRAKAFNQDSRLQSVLITTLGAITPRTWPEGSDRQFLVLPVTLEVQLRQGRNFQPQ